MLFTMPRMPFTVMSLPSTRIRPIVIHISIIFQLFKICIANSSSLISDVKYQINNIFKISEELEEENNHKDCSQKLIRLEIPTWRRSTYLMSRQIKGRSIQKVKLKNWLLGDQSSTRSSTNFSVLSITGTGGIGKTILSQLVFNNQEVQQNFEVMAWVSLCDPYKTAIYIKADESTSVSINPDSVSLKVKSEPVNFEDFHNTFVSKMKNKRFFMVLDNVWDDLIPKWETYCSLFNCGRRGSKIIVTTQLEGVANMIDSDLLINLDVLQPDEYLELFKECALSKNRSVLEESAFGNKRSRNDNLDLEDVGRGISLRFGCLPLVAVEVRHQLKYYFDKEHRNSILHSR